MLSFKNDYSEGACEEIMQALMKTNLNQTIGYGCDEICQEAKTAIQNKLHNHACDIHFLVGGTQTNQIVISSALRPYEAVIAADTGHINVHETGAIEATGHKVLISESKDGKVLPFGIEDVMKLHTDEHMVKPKMVYISNATETGSVYTKQELLELREVCDRYDLYLYMDGARFPMALMSNDSDVIFEDLTSIFDVFYLGGTKCGALFGEAVVIVCDALKTDFRYTIKQRGAMLAKGRLLGVQFLELFKNDCYERLASHANEMAQELQNGCIKMGMQMLAPSSTNQLFPILSNEKKEQLEKYCLFEDWKIIDEDHTAIRFVTSWATRKEDVDTLLKILRNLYA